MANSYYDQDAEIELIRGRRVAVIGYGSQGHAHALNLRDSGVPVKVGLHLESRSIVKAAAAGLCVESVAECAAWGDVIVMLAPDTVQPRLYSSEIAPHLDPADILMFSHGFNIRYDTIKPPQDVDVAMVAPKAPGHRMRETYLEGGGVPALVAVEQDFSGTAKELALSYAKALGCTRAGVIETSFSEETETDLFGEQAVLCGGVSALIKSGFEILVEAGYQPEIAYFECLHELKLIVDLIYQGGLSYMRYSVSDTAEYGDYTAGPKLFEGQVQDRMRKLLSEIQDGSFAKRWIDECENEKPTFLKERRQNQAHPIEQVGAMLRKKMRFIHPVQMEREEDRKLEPTFF